MKRILTTLLKTIGITITFFGSALLIAAFPMTMLALFTFGFVFVFVWWSERYKD